MRTMNGENLSTNKSKVLLMNTINSSLVRFCRHLNCHFAKSNLFTTGMPIVEATLNARRTSKTFKRLCAKQSPTLSLKTSVMKRCLKRR